MQENNPILDALKRSLGIKEEIVPFINDTAELHNIPFTVLEDLAVVVGAGVKGTAWNKTFRMQINDREYIVSATYAFGSDDNGMVLVAAKDVNSGQLFSLEIASQNTFHNEQQDLLDEAISKFVEVVEDLAK